MTTQTVTLQEAQTRLAELLTLAQTGNEIIIVKGDKPLARLVPIATPKRKRRIAGLQRGKIWVSDDFDAPLPDEFWTGEKSTRSWTHMPLSGGRRSLKSFHHWRMLLVKMTITLWCSALPVFGRCR